MADLETLFQTSGLAPGYMAGLSKGISDKELQARTAQQQAETARYSQATPFELQKLGLSNEAARLGNLSGQAKEQVGGYAAQADQELNEARQKGLQAKQAWEQLPEEHKIKMANAINQKTSQFLDTVEQVLSRTNNVPQTIATIEQQFPEISQDKGWATAKMSVQGMSPDQALSYLRQTKAKLASSNFYGSEKGQGELIVQDLKNQGGLEQQALANQGAANTAGIKSAVEKSPTMAGLLQERMSALRTETNPEVRKILQWEINAILHGQVQTETNPYGLPASERSKAIAPYPTTDSEEAAKRAELIKKLNAEKK